LTSLRFLYFHEIHRSISNLKSRDFQMKFIRKHTTSEIVGGGTTYLVLGKLKIVTLADALCSLTLREL
jgi:hypothetical protein